MVNLTFELNIYSAKDLDNVNLITKMDVYAVAWICGDDSLKNQKEKTVVDRSGGSETTWNHAVKFSIDQRLVHEGRLTLVVKLMCERIFGDKDLGEVQVPILELFTSSPPSNGDGSGNNQGMKFVTYQVKTPCGRGKGSLTFSYRFDNPPIQSNPSIHQNSVNSTPDFTSTTYPPIQSNPEPIHQNPMNSTPGFPSTTYPPSSISYPSLCEPPHPYQYESPYPPQSSSSNFNPPPSYGNSSPHPYLYPPPPNNSGHAYQQAQPSQACYGYAPPYEQNQYGYGYPPSAPNQHGYGYPPPPSAPGYGYGSPPQPHGKPPKKNNAGIGFGAGIVGGALGGLLLGDIVSDVDFF